jgi:DNA (cytosine-5)-methyltransferase 1
VSVGDALERLQRLGNRAFSTYHQPNNMPKIQREPWDAYENFLSCITCSGAEEPHPSGKRNFTPVELGQCQGLPIHHHFAGSRTNATKQVGNMFPATIAEIIFATIAKTLEAFDHGLIDADDEIEDLDITLIEKGVKIPKLTPAPTSVLDLTAPGNTSTSPYRYLSKPEISDAPPTPVGMSSPWALRTMYKRYTPFSAKKRRYSVSDSDVPQRSRASSSSGQRNKHTKRSEMDFFLGQVDKNLKYYTISDDED